jgi:hypothetical protein
METILKNEFKKIEEQVLYKCMIEETYSWIEGYLWNILENKLMIKQDKLKKLISIYVHNNKYELMIDINRLVKLED